MQGIQIDPALLAFFPSTSRRSRTAPAPVSAGIVPSEQVPSHVHHPQRIGAGHGGSASTIGVGVGVGVGLGVAPAQQTPQVRSGAVLPALVIPIDPALFELEQVVKSIRANPVASTSYLGSPTSASVDTSRNKRRRVSNHAAPASQPQTLGQAVSVIDPSLVGEGGNAVAGPSGNSELGEEFDPTIREIVKSLTNAQQNQSLEMAPADVDSTAALTQALTDAQTVAAISAHLVAAEGMEQDIQNTLEDMTSEQINSFFPQSPTSPSYLLPDYPEPPHAHAESSAQALRHQNAIGQSELDLAMSTALQAHAVPASSVAGPSLPVRAESIDSTDPSAPPKRKRGRPAGSKNKPKPKTQAQLDLEAEGILASPPPPSKKARKQTEGPPKRVGRPPKVRTGAELEQYLQRQADAAAGVKRARGRPRKFPGYLIRDMRLKQNREEFREVVRRFADGVDLSGEGMADQDGTGGGQGSGRGEGQDVGGDGQGYGHDGEEYDWAEDPQHLMDAVNDQMGAGAGGMGLDMSLGLGMEGMEDIRGEDEPSADTGLGREGMGHVFGLEGEE